MRQLWSSEELADSWSLGRADGRALGAPGSSHGPLGDRNAAPHGNLRTAPPSASRYRTICTLRFGKLAKRAGTAHLREMFRLAPAVGPRTHAGPHGSGAGTLVQTSTVRAPGTKEWRARRTNQHRDPNRCMEKIIPMN